MNTQFPRVLKNIAAYVNGLGYQGRLDEIELPDIEVKTEDFRLGGMDGESDQDMGLKKMVTKITISDPDSPLLKLVGVTGGNSARLDLRGAFKRDSDNTTSAVVAEIGGVFRKVSFGKWKAGEKAPFEYEATVNYYRLTIDGDEIFEIDVENMIRRIGGFDQLADIRAALGM
jgi:P2 family phage contractile tail tube protein